MWPYYALIVIPILFNIPIRIKKTSRIADTYGENNKRIIKTPTITIFFFILALLLSLRAYTCGADTKVYKYYFDFAQRNSLSDIFHSSTTLGENSVEIGYLLLNKIIASLSGGNYQLFLAVTAIVSLIPVWYFYNHESENAALSIILFLQLAPFSTLFSMIRQVIAMGLAIPAFYYVKEKKIVKFALIVLLAMSFHTSAAIIALLYPVYWAKFNRRSLYIVLPIIAAIFIFNRQIFPYLSIFLTDKYSTVYGNTTTTGAFGMLLLFLVIAIFVFIISDENNMSQDEKGMRNILLLVVVLQCFAPIHNIAMRLTNYYQYFIPVLLTKIITHPRENMKQVASIAKYVLGGFCLLYFFYIAYNGADILNVFPYVPFWQL